MKSENTYLIFGYLFLSFIYTVLVKKIIFFDVLLVASFYVFRIKCGVNEIDEDIQDLIDQAKSIKKNRQREYKQGFGVPRRSFNNIVYKLIEHGQYGELFEALKSITGEQLEEGKKGLF